MHVLLKKGWLFLTLISWSISAQDISIGKIEMFRSLILNEERELLLYQPKNISAKLPLVIVFDGEALFNPTVLTLQFLQKNSEVPLVPEAIVIGIVNKNRDHDMPVPQQYGTKKSEENFKLFIEKELIPWASKKYRFNGHVIAIGHSQGGLFVSYLLASSPGVFPWIVALDAPMNVDPKTDQIKEMISKSVKASTNACRYVSIEAVYGWKDDWVNYFPVSKNVLKSYMSGETHESMPYKGIYDGIRYLFQDFTPARKDLSLTALKEHYKNVSVKYGYPYEIPLRVLTASATRKLTEERKEEILELVNYAEARYESSQRTEKLKADALRITKHPNSIIDSLLSLPKPSLEQVAKYKGRWVGQKVVPRGQNMLTDLEIVVEEDRTKLLTVIPWDPSKKEEAEIFHITQDGKLVFGRRNGGGGLFVSTCSIDDKGHLVGEEWLVGFSIPEDESADFKEMMNFVLKNPNTFDLTKK